MTKLPPLTRHLNVPTNRPTKLLAWLLIALCTYLIFSGKPTQQNSVAEPVRHYAATNDLETLETAYHEAEKSELGVVPERITGLLTSHHLLASKLIAGTFASVATDKPRTVLVISPNHFSSGQGQVIGSKANWVTAYGELSEDSNLFNKLKNAELIEHYENPFEQEHGISSLVPFIKRSLPNARILPLIVNDTLNQTAALELGERIGKLLPDNTLVVGSFDFSHYLPKRAADFHDSYSLPVVQGFAYVQLHRLDTDSRPGLTLFLKILETKQAQNFHLLKQNNSVNLAGITDSLETTSYLTGYFSNGEPQKLKLPETSLALGYISTPAIKLGALNHLGQTHATKFLDRIFFGQTHTTAFTDSDAASQNILKIKQIDRPITFGAHTYQLGDLTVTYINEDNLSSQDTQIQKALINNSHIIICRLGIPRLEQTESRQLIIRGLGNLLTQENLSVQTTSSSLGVGMGYDGTELTLHLFPIQIKNGVAQVLTEQADDIILQRLANNSRVVSKIKAQILTGIVTLNLKP